MSKWAIPDNMEGVDPSHIAFDWVYVCAPWYKPGDKVTTPMFPDNVFIIKGDGQLGLMEPFKPGDRAELSPGEWYVVQDDGKTWKLAS